MDILNTLLSLTNIIVLIFAIRQISLNRKNIKKNNILIKENSTFMRENRDLIEKIRTRIK